MPDWKTPIRRRLGDSKLAPTREAEIVDELAQHLRDRYEALLAAGSSEQDAEAAVLADLNQGELAEELQRAERSWNEPPAWGADSRGHLLSALRQDIRYGARVLRLNPAFTTVCILSLALGIGANTAIFQLLDAVRMRVLPVKNPQELAVIRPQDPHRSGRMTGRFSRMTNPLWQQVRARQQGFSGVFAWGTNDGLNLADGGQARYAHSLWVSGEFFDVLGVQPLLGRVIHPSDDQKGCGTPGAVISYAFWQRQFGGDPGIVGKTIRIEGHPLPILGVTPAGFYGVEVGRNFDLAIPMCSEPVLLGENSIYEWRRGWWLGLMGRLKPGWTFSKATAQLESISPSIMAETLPPEYNTIEIKEYLAHRLTALPAANGLSSLRRDYETPLWLLLAISGLVLLIACANLANLMLARATSREREIAIRLALGAARGRLVRQLLTESLLLAAGGAVLGALLARTLSGFLVNFLSTDNSRLFVDLAMDWRVLGFTAGLAALTCLLFGLAPAVKATSAPPARIMSSAGRGLTASRERFSLRRILVVTQVALSLVLVVGALLFVRTLHNLMVLDAGFQRDGILVTDVDFTRLNIPQASRIQFREQLLDRVRAIPGVESAAETLIVPVSGSGWNDRVIVNGQVNQQDVNMNHISAGYFKTLGTPLLAGRDFDERDTLQSPKVAIVNQQFARKLFGGANPIGKTFKIDVYKGQPQYEFQIVGMVKDTKYYDLREDFDPIAFYPQTQDAKPGADSEIIIRSTLPLESLMTSVKNAIAEVNGGVTIDFHVLNTQIKEGLLRERLLATLSGFFGLLAGILATIGLYGVISYMVVRRTNEIGIRMALGARPTAILGMVLSEAFKLLAIGLAVGAVLAIAAARAATSLLFGLKPGDPTTLIAAALALAAVAVAASLLPAQRASRMDPMVALREE
jgi:putative ABC transport system permease protein